MAKLSKVRTTLARICHDALAVADAATPQEIEAMLRMAPAGSGIRGVLEMALKAHVGVPSMSTSAWRYREALVHLSQDDSIEVETGDEPR